MSKRRRAAAELDEPTAMESLHDEETIQEDAQTALTRAHTRTRPRARADDDATELEGTLPSVVGRISALLAAAKRKTASVEALRRFVVGGLSPLAEDALHLVGGSGADEHLRELITGAAPTNQNPLFAELRRGFRGIHRAQSSEAVIAEGHKLLQWVEHALESPERAPLRLAWMKRELGTRCDLATLLSVAFAADPELLDRRPLLRRELELVEPRVRTGHDRDEADVQRFLRQQIELRLIDAELALRTSRS